jgi:hypothetical protein
MNDRETSRAPRAKQRNIVGFSLAPDLASKVKAEAGRRQIRLNKLFEEMWRLYEQHRPKEKS